ncbi:MAG: RidA family protein [Acidobacteria bacterium]|nr:RidA family protein [Acidobacteriota bacterium]
MSAESRLAHLGIALPEPPAPVAAYVPWTRSGALVFVSGQLPFRGGALPRTGSVGAEVSADEAVEEARAAAINALAVLRAAAGSLDHVARVVKLTVFVASAPGFRAQPQVANGASELMAAVFGEAGRHAREAVGVAELPLGAPVEIELIAEIAG